MDFYDAHPQGEEWAHSHIKIGAFFPPHRLLAKIVLHNLWATARRSELVLKRARFLYALVMRMPFCLYKNILQIMLKTRDAYATGLPFACLVMKICLRFVTDIAETEPKVRVQDALGSQTLMKSNAHLWFEGQGEAPQPSPVQGDLHAASSSSQTAPPPSSYDAGFAQMMDILGALQREVRTISVRVEQCQIDIKECLKHHHPHNDDEDWVLWSLLFFFRCLFKLLFLGYFWENLLLFMFLDIFIFITVVFLYSVYPLSSWDKKEEYFYFWTRIVFLNRSSDFCPKMAKMGVC
jgi:hypothetical protein